MANSYQKRSCFASNPLHTMKNCKMLLFFVFAAALLTAGRGAAQSGFSDFAEMQKRMLELQRKMMQEFQRHPFGGLFDFEEGLSDSTYSFFKFDTSFSSDGKGAYFKFDTSFSDGSAMHFFRFSPFGNDTTGMRNAMPFGFDRFFGEDINPQQRGRRGFPKDDGGERFSEEDLLPEERLRQEEDAQGMDQKNPGGEAKPEGKAGVKKPKLKTIRI